MEPSTSSSSSSWPVCKVCGGERAGNHYNGMVCSCCRVFFLRQTRRTRQPECKSQRKCTISPGAIDNCQSCRYKKCLEIGMRPTDVGKQKYTKRRKKIPPEESMPTNGEIIMVAEEYTTKRKKRADTYPVVLEEQQEDSIVAVNDTECWVVGEYQKPEPRRAGPSQMIKVDSNFSAGFMVLNTLRSAKTASDYINCLTSLQSFVDNPKGLDPIDVYANVEASLADVLLNSQACSSRAAAAWDKWSPVSGGHFSMKHVYCRSITRYVDYLTAAPELFNLPETDKMKLIQSNSTDLTVFGAVYEMWKRQIDTSGKYLADRSNRFQLTLAAHDQEKVNNLQMILIPYFEYLMEKMRGLGMNTGEFLILKYIVFFTAPVGISYNGTCIINGAREKYCNLLSSYLIEMDPLMPWSVRLRRVADLIGMVRMIKEAAIFVKQLYANFASTNTAGMAGSLTFDLHLREY